MQVNIIITNSDLPKVVFKTKTVILDSYIKVDIIVEPILSLVVLTKLFWSLIGLVWPLVVIVVFVYPLLVLVCPFVFSFVILVCPLVVLVCLLVVSVCVLVVLIVLSVGLLITDRLPSFHYCHKLILHLILKKYSPDYTARKTIFSFSRRPEKMVFPKKLCWNMIFLVLSGKMIFLFPENMILHVRRKMKDDLS